MPSIPVKHVVSGSSAKDLLARDIAIAKAIEERLAKKSAGASADDGPISQNPGPAGDLKAGVKIITEVGVGDPTFTHTLLVDINRDFTWIGAIRQYVPTASSKPTGKTFQVFYYSIAENGASGKEYVDDVTFIPGLEIRDQHIGVADEVVGYDGLDGVLGLSPTYSYTQGIGITPTSVLDNLVAQGKIKSKCIGLYIGPVSTDGQYAGGDLSFGTIDPTKYVQPIAYGSAPNIQDLASWSLQLRLSYGYTDTPLGGGNANNAVIDVGQISLGLPDSIFAEYKSIIGAEIDEDHGLLYTTKEQAEKLRPLYLDIGARGQYVQLSAQGQLWPPVLYSQLGLPQDRVYLIVTSMVYMKGVIVLGSLVLQHFYTVYDVDNSRIGFAMPRSHRAE